MNGLSINQKEFMSLPSKKQMGVLFQNEVQILYLTRSYKFHQKVQYILLTSLIAGIGIIFKLQVGI